MKIGSFGQDWLDIALFGPSGCVGVWIGHLKAKPCSLSKDGENRLSAVSLLVSPRGRSGRHMPSRSSNTAYLA